NGQRQVRFTSMPHIGNECNATPHPTPSGPPDEPTCPHCGADICIYAEEQPMCAHCGAILDLPPPTPPTWLSLCPAPKRSILAQHFYNAVRSGVTDLPAIVDHVATNIHRRLQWTSDFEQRQFWGEVVNSFADNPKAVRDYAASVLATEQLPATERAALKREKAKAFVLEAMKGKPVTEKQLWLLRSKGYRGEMPTDRAQATDLIDTLLTRTGARQSVLTRMYSLRTITLLP